MSDFKYHYPRPQDNPYNDLTTPEMYAFIYKQYGEAGFREILDKCKELDCSWREPNEEHVRELRWIGLHKVADILDEYIRSMKSLNEYLRG